MFDVRRERERFLTDPLISAFDGLLVRIHMAAIPTYVVSEGNIIVERKYDPETRALVGKIEKERKEYVEAEYGISEGDKKWH